MSATFKTDAVQASFQMDGRPITFVELIVKARIAVVIKIDRLTLIVSDYETLLSLTATWGLVSKDASTLPLLQTGLLNLGGSMGVGQIKVSADLYGEHEGTSVYVPETDEAVAHVRIQFGGLTWLVEDLLAYTTVSQALDRAVTVMAEGLANQE